MQFSENFTTRFSRGFAYPFRSGRFIIRHPGLLRYIVIPFIINAAFFSLAVYFGLDFFNDTVVGRIPREEAWYWLFLFYILWVLALLATAVLVFFSFTIIGNLIASPFSDLLSEKTEQILTGNRAEEPFSTRGFFRDAWKTLKEESKKMALFAGGMILLLGLNLLPVAGTAIFMVLSLLFTLFFLSVEYTGYIFGRKHLGFREQRRYILSRKFLMAGFAAGVLMVLAIPFIQFFCIPLAVVGATLLWHEENESGPEEVNEIRKKGIEP